MSGMRDEDAVEWKANAHDSACGRGGKGETSASPLSRLWARDFSPWTSVFS